MRLMVLNSKGESNKCRAFSFHWKNIWLGFFLWISEKWQCFCIKHYKYDFQCNWHGIL